MGAVSLLAGWLFRRHLLGLSTFLGNPDRLNNNLKIFKHQVDGLVSTGRIPAWSDYELLGYDTFSLPYTFPNPFTHLAGWFGAENIYVFAGCESALLFALAGIFAYLFIREVTGPSWPAFTGALLYQFSSLTVLKVSQNDMSFVVFVFAPLLLLAIRRIRDDNRALQFTLIAVLMFCMLQFAFLQKVAYVFALATAYAAYRMASLRVIAPLVVFCAAGAVATAGAFPRIWGLRIAMSEFVRIGAPSIPKPLELDEVARWFDPTVFGLNFVDAVNLGNLNNLSEGMLIYASAAVPLVLIAGLIRYRDRFLGVIRLGFGEAAFMLFALVGCLYIVFSEAGQMLIFKAFAKVEFIHYRVLIAALLPMCTLWAMILADRAASANTQSNSISTRTALQTCAVGASAMVVLEYIAQYPDDLVFLVAVPYLPERLWRGDAAIRIGGSLLFAAALLWYANRRSGVRRESTLLCLASFSVIQVIAMADMQLNGRTGSSVDVPFNTGNVFQAPKGMFVQPDQASVRSVHDRLHPEFFRTLFLCDRRIAGGFCAAHLAERWNLRAVDGYYGLGVPARLARLPIGNALGMRHMNFVSDQGLPWKTLGLLNVKYALRSSAGLYGNTLDRTIPELKVIENPEPVVPRAFFAAHTTAVGDAARAAQLLFRDGSLSLDVTQRSVVEGLDGDRSFSASVGVRIEGSGDRLSVIFAPSEHERFLVINELPYPGWQARIDGMLVPLYPTNVVMRGLIVPPRARSATLQYESFVSGLVADAIRTAALALLAVGFVFFSTRRLRQ